MKVYIVSSDWGCWDDCKTCIEKVFSSEKSAKEYKEKFEIMTKYIPPCPVDEEKGREDELDEIEQNLYDEWYIKFLDNRDFNCCIIKEIELED